MTTLPANLCDERTTPIRFMVGHVGVSAVDMNTTVNEITRCIHSSKPAYVCVANIKTTLLCQRNQHFCNIENHSMLTLPDGMPLVWYAHLAGLKNVQRVTGPDLMLRFLAESPDTGFSHYFLGDTPSTLHKMAQTISQKYPHTKIKGMRSPPFRCLSHEEQTEIIDEINRLRPSLVWVGLGAPKQERWMQEAIDRIDCSVLVGVGAAFRFLIGEYKHPPAVFQKMGLEGLFWRLSKNPLRLLGGYCQWIPGYSWLVLRMLANRLRGRVPYPAGIEYCAGKENS